MIDMLRDLIQHKGHANAVLLKTIREHDAAAQDEELFKLLHHIILANRYLFSLCLGIPFSVENESRAPGSLQEVSERYQETQAKESDWISAASAADLEKAVESPFLPGSRLTVAQVMMQACMHSVGHRAQCLGRLRELGGTPPLLDFILWLKDRPPAEW